MFKDGHTGPATPPEDCINVPVIITVPGNNAKSYPAAMITDGTVKAIYVDETFPSDGPFPMHVISSISGVTEDCIITDIVYDPGDPLPPAWLVCRGVCQDILTDPGGP